MTEFELEFTQITGMRIISVPNTPEMEFFINTFDRLVKQNYIILEKDDFLVGCEGLYPSIIVPDELINEEVVVFLNKKSALLQIVSEREVNPSKSPKFYSRMDEKWEYGTAPNGKYPTIILTPEFIGKTVTISRSTKELKHFLGAE